jgi:hypothetical protein
MKLQSLLLQTCALALLATAVGSATAQSAASDIQARYAQEREKCMTHNTQDLQATCQREAANARHAARKGQLGNPGDHTAANATQRCDAFQSAQDRAECVRRIESKPASGSVPGGGVLRESVTTTIEPK